MRKRWWYDVRCWVWWAHDKFGGCKQQDHGSFVLLSWWWCSCKIHQKDSFEQCFSPTKTVAKRTGINPGLMDLSLSLLKPYIDATNHDFRVSLTILLFSCPNFYVCFSLTWQHWLRNFADLWMTKRANDMATTRHSLHHFQHTALHPSIILLSHQQALVDFWEKMQGWVSKDSPVLLRDRSVPRSEWCVF